jgi:membrane dipeptidase
MKVVDMHCDTIAEIFYSNKEGKESGLLKNKLHLDLEKMNKGDYLLQNFAMFVDIKNYENPLEHCFELIDLFYNQLEINKDKIAIALNYDDIMKNEAAGKMSAVLTIEEGGVTKNNLAHLRKLLPPWG